MTKTMKTQNTSKWKVDSPHAKVGFSTVHSTISDVAGIFNSFDTTIVASEEDFSDAVFELTIDVASIGTDVDKRDEHLRSPDFFQVEKYPAMTFKSTSIEETQKENRYKLTGNLTMHGATKTVTMDLWYRGTIKNPQTGAITAGFQVTGTINRSNFNIATKIPKYLVSDEVFIKADGEFVKQED